MFSIKKLQNVIADWWKTRVNLDMFAKTEMVKKLDI